MSNEELWIQTWEEFMNWQWDNPWFDLSGRDIISMIIGFMICLFICAYCDGKEIHIGKIVRRRKNKNIPGN